MTSTNEILVHGLKWAETGSPSQYMESHDAIVSTRGLALQIYTYVYIIFSLARLSQSFVSERSMLEEQPILLYYIFHNDYDYKLAS